MAAAAALDPELLLPPKTIIMPAPRIAIDPGAGDETVIYRAFATQRYTHVRYGLQIQVTPEMLANSGIEEKIAREVRRAMDELSRDVFLEPWTVNRSVSTHPTDPRRQIRQTAARLSPSRLPA